VILLGSLLLSLPIAHAAEPVSVLDAFFTATSATCVTGLTVVDTGTRFSPFGQAVVLGLIQVGGLGLMTFAVFVGIALGGRVAFTERMVIQETMHHTPSAGVRRLVRHVLAFTLVSEALGALWLWLRLRDELPAATAVWSAVFHAVSAFCNAGFSLFPDNLVRFRGDLAVNLGITGLIILGGFGFLASMELRDQLVARLRRLRPAQATLHTRLVLAVTAALLLGGILAVTVGLVVVGGATGWGVATALRFGAGVHLAPRRRVVAAVAFALGAVALGQAGIWQYARIEGGVLPPLEYLAEVFGLLVPIQFAVAGIVAWLAAR